jgi:hypothetical protein
MKSYLIYRFYKFFKIEPLSLLDFVDILRNFIVNLNSIAGLQLSEPNFSANHEYLFTVNLSFFRERFAKSFNDQTSFKTIKTVRLCRL